MSSIVSNLETVLNSTRFQFLWKHSLPEEKTNNGVQVWNSVIEHHSEGHRRYHDKKHLAFCLQQLDSAAHLVEDRVAVEMAIWFHDIVYQPDAGDNEENSATLFRYLVTPYLQPDLINKVCKIILATKHIDAPENADQAFMLDIDLSSMGLPWKYFCRDANDLRTESSNTSNRRYYSEKLKFYDVLLKKPTIYYSDFFSELYEGQARKNIVSYSTLLKSLAYQ